MYLCSIYDVAVRPDGQKLYVASGGKILVSAVLVVCVFILINLQLYHASNGVFEKAVKAHKEVVYCLSVIRDGKLNASIVI